MLTINDLDLLTASSARKTLFERLFNHVWILEPRIVVDRELTETLREFRDVVAVGGETFLGEGAYSLLFQAVVEGQIGSSDVGKVSLQLLTWFGEIGDVCFDSGDRVIDLGTAIMLLAAAEDDSARSVVWCEGDAEDTVRVTLQGTRALGLTGSVPLGAKYRATDVVPPASANKDAFQHRLPQAADALVRCASACVSIAPVSKKRGI